ncbi:MAG: hypothetical protein GY842_12420 [bacterium]|nr:hypothetical protein [bacterium]
METETKKRKIEAADTAAAAVPADPAVPMTRPTPRMVSGVRALLSMLLARRRAAGRPADASWATVGKASLFNYFRGQGGSNGA